MSSWFYDDLAGWLRDGELDADVPLHIFNEVAAEIFGPPPPDPVCLADLGTSVIAGVTASGRHHLVEAAAG